LQNREADNFEDEEGGDRWTPQRFLVPLARGAGGEAATGTVSSKSLSCAAVTVSDVGLAGSPQHHGMISLRERPENGWASIARLNPYNGACLTRRVEMNGAMREPCG